MSTPTPPTSDKAEESRSREHDDDVVMTFPQRMMEILSNDENTNAITWLHHGRGFIIYNKKKFASEVLPRYFKQSKFTSFTRKLNRWGFVRVTQRGPEMGAYYHKFFQRDNPTLCLRMSCETVKVPKQKNDLVMLPQTPTAAAGVPVMPAPAVFQPTPNEAALIAQNTLLRQQLMLRMEHERTMSTLYMQMLQQKGIDAPPLPTFNQTIANNSMNASLVNTAVTPPQVPAETEPPVQKQAEVRKAQAA